MIAKRLLGALAAGAALLLGACQGVIVHEERSAYSRIRVVDVGAQRALYFLGDAEIDVTETLIDRNAPHVLQHPYARAAMAGLLYRPDPRRVLLIGLGGGALVRFLNHHFRDLDLDVVEIDPAVVRIAREFFGTDAGARTRIIVADGRDYLRDSAVRYDLVLIDAHLHPSDLTDAAGHPLSLNTAAFYASVRARLAPDGIAMFNMIAGADAERLAAQLRRAFADTETYRPKASGNLIVFASPERLLAPEAVLRERARALDRRGGFGFAFEALLDERAEGDAVPPHKR